MTELLVEGGPTSAEVRPSFGEVARPHLPWLYSLARRLVGRRAEDAVQDMLLRAFRAYGDLRDQEALGGWLRRILVNTCNDLLRDEMRGPEEEPFGDVEDYSLYRALAEEDPLPYSDSLHLDFLAAFTTDDVWAVLERLAPIYRVPLVLVHMEGYPTREVADALDVPLNTILSRLHRGRKLFEKELWGYAEENQLLRETEGARA